MNPQQVYAALADNVTLAGQLRCLSLLVWVAKLENGTSVRDAGDFREWLFQLSEIARANEKAPTLTRD